MQTLVSGLGRSLHNKQNFAKDWTNMAYELHKDGLTRPACIVLSSVRHVLLN